VTVTIEFLEFYLMFKTLFQNIQNIAEDLNLLQRMHLYIQSLTCSLQVQAAALIKLLRILFFLPTIITFFLRTTCVWMLEQFTRSIMFDKCNMFTRLCSCKRARVSCTSAWFASMGAQ
jgi:hypothetical protein